jgi:hypothetical protein
MSVEEIKYYNAWRTIKGEHNMKNDKFENENKQFLHWYSCADVGMENEIVLCYAIYEHKLGNNINLKFDDKYIQKKTGTGKNCSGKVTKWIRKANKNEYNEDGTLV